MELELLFRLSLEMLCIAGADGYFKRVNPAFERTLGYRADELLARPFFEFVHADDLQKTRDELAKLAAGMLSVHFQNRYRRKDGSYCTLQWTAAPEPGGQRIFATASDITERRRANERFQRLVEFSPDAMLLVDGKGHIVLVNAQAEAVFGYTRDELLAENVALLVPEGARDAHAALCRNYAARPTTGTMGGRRELKARRKDGSEFYAEISLGPIETEAEALIVCVIRDVTERRRIEQTLQENEVQMLAAQHIQQHLLPAAAPPWPGLDVGGKAVPATFTSGDYFDYLTLADGARAW